MPAAKCPECAREVPEGAVTCPWDGAAIRSYQAPAPVLAHTTPMNPWTDSPGTSPDARPGDGAGPELGAPAASAWNDSTQSTQESLRVLLPGQKLGDYEVREMLGQGGMGEVYSGEQPMIGKRVAIKVLRPE